MKLEEVAILGENLLREHGLLNKGWYFKFDSAEKRFGCCNYSERSISLSKVLVELNGAEQVVDTLKHEVAHAIVGSGYGHSFVWQQKAKELGCSAERCYSSKEVVTPPDKKLYLYECPNCGIKIKKNYKMQLRRACKRCCDNYNDGYFSTEYLFVYRGKIVG